MATDKNSEGENVVPMSRHVSSEPAGVPATTDTTVAEAPEVEVQESRHVSSEPVD